MKWKSRARDACYRVMLSCTYRWSDRFIQSNESTRWVHARRVESLTTSFTSSSLSFSVTSRSLLLTVLWWHCGIFRSCLIPLSVSVGRGWNRTAPGPTYTWWRIRAPTQAYTVFSRSRFVLEQLINKLSKLTEHFRQHNGRSADAIYLRVVDLFIG